MYSGQSKEQIVIWLTCLPRSLFTLVFYLLLWVLKVYNEGIRNKCALCVSGAAGVEIAFRFHLGNVVSVFIDLIDYHEPQGP